MSIFRSPKLKPIDPDEIFLDAFNLPALDDQQFEGRLEKPISRRTFRFLIVILALIGVIFLTKIVDLQLNKGEIFATRSANNTLRRIPIFAKRGLIYDRRREELVWNNPDRQYASETGLAHLLGYISYPSQNDLERGEFDPQELIGKDGAERLYDSELKGQVGIKIEEVDVLGQIHSGYILNEAKNGADIVLSIDERLQNKLASLIKDLAEEKGYVGGAGVIMDIYSGELLALVSLPEYNSQILAQGKDRATINSFLTNKSNPFLDRALFGLYTPGSIVKPIIALGVLNENIISPEKKILSTGELFLPNPFFPDQKSIFKDWKAHGWVDMKEAIAFSSNVYFYEVGGGFENQIGLGIKRIEKYAKMFGLGNSFSFDGLSTPPGVVPTPEWKAENFNGEEWRVGDTYHTAIGQYGFQVTPLQIARMIAAIANDGYLLKPTLRLSSTARSIKKNTKERLPIAPQHFSLVREAMRLAVTTGTAGGLNIPDLEVAAKTGTAELGSIKKEVNSWVVGFFPYDAPRYSFAVVMERGPRENLVGGTYIMRSLLEWMKTETPEYWR